MSPRRRVNRDRPEDTTPFRVPMPDGPIEVKFDGRPGRDAWFGRYTDDRRDRRHIRLGETRADAERVAYRLYHDGLPGHAAMDPRRQKISAFLEDYLAAKRRAGDTPKQLQEIESSLRRFREHVSESLGRDREVFVSDCTREALDKWLDSLERADRAGRTVNKHRGMVKSFFAWLEAEERIDRDPMRAVRARAANKPRRIRRAATEDEIGRIFEASRRTDAGADHLGFRYGTARAWEPVAYAVAMMAGLRQGEVMSLKWVNLDLDRHNDDGQWSPVYNLRPWEQKSRKENTVALDEHLAEILAEHRRAERRRLGRTPELDKRVLPTMPRNPLPAWKDTLLAAGVAYRDGEGRVLDWHAMRHTFCTLTGRGTMDTKTKQNLMRHADIRMTGRYDHADIERQREALAKTASPIGALAIGRAELVEETPALGARRTKKKRKST